MANSTVTFGLKKCDECKEQLKYNKAIDVFNSFDWGYAGALSFDKKTKEILISEKELMRIIKLVNPIQEDRKIMLII